MNEVYIVSAKRTPVGKFGGAFTKTSATELGTIVIKSLLEKNQGIAKYINEVILGNVLSGGLGQNPARIVSMQSGIDQKAPAFTVNKVCGSGLKSVILAAQAIQNEDAQVIIAGGMENMSRAPFLIENYRFGVKAGNQIIKDYMIYNGLFCSLIGEHMGMTGEYVAEKYNISREEQDAYSLESHTKAIAAIENDAFREEIVPISTPDNKALDTDEQPRKDTNLEALRKLPPAFKKDGTVTAGNSSSLNDGAAAMIVTSLQFAKKHRIKPLAIIRGYASVGLDPKFMGMGSYYAAIKCLEKAQLKTSDIDVWEINEAFASQSLAALRLLKINKEKVNVNGGAIALGHPIGASGTRILTTLMYELKRRSKRYGVASLCIGGGQGIAMVVENV